MSPHYLANHYEIRFSLNQSRLAYHFPQQDLLTENELAEGSNGLLPVAPRRTKTVTVDVDIASDTWGWTEEDLVVYVAAVTVDDEGLKGDLSPIVTVYIGAESTPDNDGASTAAATPVLLLFGTMTVLLAAL